MAVYNITDQHTNNLEKRIAIKAYRMDFARQGSEGRRPDTQLVGLPFNDGDVAFVGTLPSGTFVTSVTLAISQFDAGTTFDIGTSSYNQGGITNPIASGVVADGAGYRRMPLELPLNGNFKIDGSALTEVSMPVMVFGNVTDTADEYFAVAIHSTGELTKGRLEIIVEYQRYGTDNGAY